MTDRFLSDPSAISSVVAAAQRLADALRAGGKILVCGNGGSLCQAMHFATELTGRYRDSRRPLAAVALCDPGHLSCVGNDYDFSETFSRQILAFGSPGDVLLALSTSGDSPNVVRAVEAAHARGMMVVALTGRGGGELARLADVEIRAPASPYADRAQELHLKVLHVLTAALELDLPRLR